ncbi:hypothetical protein Aab01nite_19950 [Paractinoplanes abujensis]|uniref:Arginase n=1 Tax=Paractinoplanes abujensis TaxID=882441 RepID=A0A7W7G7M2_9ACTN|nr:arginase [Actinoplanes abujensis]GID18405.1 hypothetical protein Aab01nite_19950 [Actinoplanes abujensis]
MRRIAVLDAPSNLGLRPPTATSVPGCAKAPGALRDHGLISKLDARDAGCLTPPRYDAGDWRPGDGVAHAAQIAAYSRALADRIGGILDAGEFPVVLGGDCSILLGSGLAMNRLGDSVGGRIGLVFVDGHSDFRHPGNASYVGAAAGEDLALVTGRGQADLAAIEGRRPYFRDVDVVVMGIRAQDEYRLDLQAAGIVTRPVTALRAEGAARSAQWARDQLVDCAGYWVHMDVDVLDPAVMPAVDAPSPGGIAFPELEILLAGLVESPHCLGVEITVFDPDYDPDGSYAAEIVSAITAGLANAHTVTPRPDLIAARADLNEPAVAQPSAPDTEGPGRLGPSAPRFNRAESLLAGLDRAGSGPGGLNRGDSDEPDRESGGLGREPGGLGREPGGLGRESGSNSETSGLDRGPDALGREPGETGGLNREPGSLGRESGGPKREPGSFGRESGGLNREPGAFGLGPGGGLGREPGGLGRESGGLNRDLGGLNRNIDLDGLTRGEAGAPGRLNREGGVGLNRGDAGAAGLIRPRSPNPRVGRAESLIAGLNRGGSQPGGLRRPAASAGGSDEEHEREQRRAAAAGDSVSLAATGMSQGVSDEVALPATTLLGVEEADEVASEHEGSPSSDEDARLREEAGDDVEPFGGGDGDTADAPDATIARPDEAESGPHDGDAVAANLDAAPAGPDAVPAGPDAVPADSDAVAAALDAVPAGSDAVAAAPGAVAGAPEAAASDSEAAGSDGVAAGPDAEGAGFADGVGTWSAGGETGDAAAADDVEAAGSAEDGAPAGADEAYPVDPWADDTDPTGVEHLEEGNQAHHGAYTGEPLKAADPAAVEPADAAVVDADPAEAEPIAMEPAEAEHIVAESADVERVDVESADAERIDVESAEAERVDVESADAELIDVEAAEAELIGTERADAELIDVESAEVELVDGEPDGSGLRDDGQPGADAASGGVGEAPVRLVPRPLGSAPLLDSEPLPATRPGMLRPRVNDEEPFSLPAQRPAFDLGSGAPADVN